MLKFFLKVKLKGILTHNIIVQWICILSSHSTYCPTNALCNIIHIAHINCMFRQWGDIFRELLQQGCANEEECKLPVHTQLYLQATISYMFWLYIAIIRLNTVCIQPDRYSCVWTVSVRSSLLTCEFKHNGNVFSETVCKPPCQYTYVLFFLMSIN